MEKVQCLYEKPNNYIEENAYNIYDFPFNELKSKQIGKSKYIELPITYDIETSTIKDKIKSIKENKDCYMGYAYHHQMCIEDNVLFYRTWKEFLKVLKILKNVYDLNDNKKLVIYVHNLSYEFQFFYRFVKVNSVFATDSHKVLKCVVNDVFEFRCSYYLSNQNLLKFIENTGGKYIKGKGDLDYRKVFTTKSELTLKEKGYCYNDVKGLYHAILFELQYDTLDTIPLTSTGYVRRDCRNEMRKNKKNHEIFIKTQLDLTLYLILKETFRGGNTASNRYLTNMIIDEVNSYDMSSAYPFVMLSEKFPMGQFMNTSIEEIEELEEYNKKYCTVGKYIFTNVKLKDGIPIPYIPFSKCQSIKEYSNYNGRILNAEYLEIYCTNIDYDIINNQYEYYELYVTDFYFSRKDYLPKELRKKVVEYFYNKSTLKNVEDKSYEYMKSKNKLNAIYGMSVTDILHEIINFTYDTGDYEIEEKTETEKKEEIEKYYKNRNNFLSYQWGVFVTSYCRRNLQLAIDKIGLDVVYCDTDSVKYIGNYDYVFEKINSEFNKKCESLDVKNYIEYNGKTFYLGLYDKEPGYLKFKTLGAKKYAFVSRETNELGVTVSGLNKEKGAKELKEKGGINAFEIGTTFYDSGRTTAYYNNEDIHVIEVDGVKIETASNIALVDTTYTLGISDTMLSILESL